MHQRKTVYLLLGSNLGDRLLILQSAIELIEKQIGVIRKISKVYQTAPWGVLDQPAFLNQVVELEVDLSPEDILRLVLSIENELGRVRYERWGARVIDIDILFYDDLVIDSARLTVPHPRLHERRFTLIPLAEIAPHFSHPLLHKNIEQLLSECVDDSDVQIF